MLLSRHTTVLPLAQLPRPLSWALRASLVQRLSPGHGAVLPPSPCPHRHSSLACPWSTGTVGLAVHLPHGQGRWLCVSRFRPAIVPHWAARRRQPDNYPTPREGGRAAVLAHKHASGPCCTAQLGRAHCLFHGRSALCCLGATARLRRHALRHASPHGSPSCSGSGASTTSKSADRARQPPSEYFSGYPRRHQRVRGTALAALFGHPAPLPRLQAALQPCRPA